MQDYARLLLRNRFRHEQTAEVRPVTIMVDDVQLGCVRHLHHCVRRTWTGDVVGLIPVLDVSWMGNIGSNRSKFERVRFTLAVKTMQLRCMVELLWSSLDKRSFSFRTSSWSTGVGWPGMPRFDGDLK